MYKTLLETCCTALAPIPHPLGCLDSSSWTLTITNTFSTTKPLAIRFKELFLVFRASPLPVRYSAKNKKLSP